MRIAKRLYDDFFRPSKIEDYERVIRTASECGYEFHSICSFEQLDGRLEPEKKYFILRRDIDTADIAILRKMLYVEKKYGARCSYYFRLSTMDVDFMREIQDNGGEASYHYEEIASYCYRHHLKNKNLVLVHMEDIRKMFIRNYFSFKQKTGCPCLTIASHGDYMNVQLGIRNAAIIDERVRQETGIIREAYDEQHESLLEKNIADLGDKDFAEEIIGVLKDGYHVVEWLTHPRQWNSPVWINLKEEVSRIGKGLYMKF